MNSYARHSARFERLYRTALTDIAKLLKQSQRRLPKSAQPIPFASESTLQDLEDALCSGQPLHTLLAGARQ